MRMADCHPDRPHVAKGMCRFCYMQDYDKRRGRKKSPEEYSPNYRKPPKPKKSEPTCGHPDRRAATKGGLCHACYQRARRSGEIIVGRASCHPDRPALAKGLCHQCYAKNNYWDSPEKYREEQRKIQAERRQRYRDELIAAYGGKCACKNCPETNQAFLCLDHVNGDGKTHRLKVGSHVYADLRRRGFPQEGYRLLCWNCNSATRFGRTCPHEDE